MTLQNKGSVSTAHLLWLGARTTIYILIDTATWRLIDIFRFVVIALFAAVRLLVQSEERLGKYRIFALVFNGSWSSLFHLVGERWSYLERLILLKIERSVGGGRTPAVSISSCIELMVMNLLIHWEWPRNKGAWLNDSRLLVTNLVMRRKEISNSVVLKMLILQLSWKEWGKHYLLLLLQHLKISLHHHFIDSCVSATTTSILTRCWRDTNR